MNGDLNGGLVKLTQATVLTLLPTADLPAGATGGSA
jgi:hypothetical protein